MRASAAWTLRQRQPAAGPSPQGRDPSGARFTRDRGFGPGHGTGHCCARLTVPNSGTGAAHAPGHCQCDWCRRVAGSLAISRCRYASSLMDTNPGLLTLKTTDKLGGIISPESALVGALHQPSDGMKQVPKASQAPLNTPGAQR